jgi:hypothetical protein
MNSKQILTDTKQRLDALTGLATAYLPVLRERWAPIQARLETARVWWQDHHMTPKVPYAVAGAVILTTFYAASQDYFVTPGAQPAQVVAERIAPIGTLNLADTAGSPQVAEKAAAGAGNVN